MLSGVDLVSSTLLTNHNPSTQDKPCYSCRNLIHTITVMSVGSDWPFGVINDRVRCKLCLA